MQSSGWRTAILAALIGVACVPAPTAAQSAQVPAPRTTTPPRDGAAAPQKGTGIVRGRVVAAEGGRPLRRARITLTGEGGGPDSRRLTSTSLDGRYEFKDLPAGRYRVSVQRGGYLPLDYGQRRPGEQGRPVQLADAQTLENVDFHLPRMGIITGRVTDEDGEPVEGVTIAATRSLFYEGQRRLVPVVMTDTDDAGEYRIAKLPPGTYYVMATTKDTWTVTERGKETVFGYLPTFLPGVAVASSARAVKVAIGQSVAGADLALVPGRAAKVAGIALDSQGRPFARVSLSEEIRGLNFASFRGGPSGAVAADGSFSILNVPPGTYTAQAVRLPGDNSGEPEVALMQLVVDGTDLDNIVLSGSKGGTVSGRVSSETGPLPAKGVRVAVAETLRGQPSPALLGTFRSSRNPAEIGAEGEFTATNVYGRVRFQVTVPEGWMLRSVTHDTRDLTDGSLELGSGETVSGVEVQITNRVTSVAGQVLDAKSAPVGDATVLVFAKSAEKWFESSRWVRAARPDQQGKWQLKALPPGEYLAIALDYVEDGAWNDPEYLEALRASAETVTLPEGGSETVSLKLATPKQ